MTNTQAPQESTVGAWFDSLEPPPPPELSRVLQGVLSASFARPSSDVPEICLQSAEEMLTTLMQSGSTERATALTLLAVDSLVTYAFEAAAGDAGRIEERAARAMSRIANLAQYD